jgi:beta-galactosidase GanA
MNRMADYWRSRYLHALSRLEAAESPNTRFAYLGLAGHYLAMQQFCERTPAHEGVETIR